MSYVKLFKVTQDFPLGYQTLNQAIDNNEALKDLYDVKHFIPSGNNGSFTSDFMTVGRHDDIFIARTVADFWVDTSVVDPVLTPRVSGPIFGNLYSQRVGTGQWRIYLSTPQLFGAVALMKSTAASDYKATCLVTYTSNGPCVTVSTWNIATPATEDLPFSLVVWAQRSL